MPVDDEASTAQHLAEEMEHSVELTEKDEQDTISLLEKLDKLATAYREHARNWDDVNPEVAARVRKQEQEIHELHQKVVRMAEMESEELKAMMVEIDGVLKRARRPKP